MKTIREMFKAVAVFLLLAGGAFWAVPAPAHQSAPSRAGTRPAADVLARIGQGAGVTVLADSTITERVPLPATPATPENFEQQIAGVVKALPQGTSWVKLYLPAPAGDRSWNGDDVAALALAQVKLFGSGGAPAPGTVEILGQRLPMEKAREHITGLNLKPVYLVTNAGKRATAGVNAMPFAQMTPEQQQAYAREQAERLLAGDNATRQAFVREHLAIMGQLMRQMTPEQRQQMLPDADGVVFPVGEPGPGAH